MLGEWYPDDFDYRRMLTLSGGAPLVAGWRAGGRWRFVGGRPFTRWPIVELEEGLWLHEAMRERLLREVGDAMDERRAKLDAVE